MNSLQTINKALASAAAGALVAWLSKKGIVLDTEALAIILGGLIAFVTTYFAPKNQPLSKQGTKK